MAKTLPPPNIVERAKSGRSVCGSCKQAISKGSKRVGVRRWAPFRKRGSGYLSVRWHHAECIAASGSLTPDSAGRANRSCTELLSHDLSSRIDQFSRAARLAVSKQITDFGERTLHEAELPLACPYTGDVLEDKNYKGKRVLFGAHVHHCSPKGFKDIVQGFVQSAGINLDLVSYVSGQFANADMEHAFCSYHEEHSRLLLVSAHANLSIVKLNPALGPCDYCKFVGDLKWIFGEGICEHCREKSSVKWLFPSQRLANKIFALKPSDLVGLECELMTNPKNPGFAPMKLYRMRDLESAAKAKHGSLEAAQMLVRRAEEERQKHRAEQYQLAKSFEMRLRSKKPRTFADDIDHHGDFATSSQLRYLRALKLETPIGISKAHASQLIDSKLQSNHSTDSSSNTCHKDTDKSGAAVGLMREKESLRRIYTTPFLAFVAGHDATVLFSDDANEHQRVLAMLWRSLSELEQKDYHTSPRMPNNKRASRCHQHIPAS
jgi:hypothetical protein